MQPAAQGGAAGVVLGAEEGIAAAGKRWSELALAGVLLFAGTLYANPSYFVEQLGRVRFGMVSAALFGGAVLARRVRAGVHVRTGAPPSVLLFAYAAIAGLSILWTIQPRATRIAVGDIAKLLVVYLGVLNALDSRRRLRTALLVAALASLAPAVGGIRTWQAGDALVEGTRTHWVGIFADPNRLAMSLVAVMPFALLWLELSRKLAGKVLLSAVVLAQVAAIVLTESRSGAVSGALAVLLFLGRRRGGSGLLKGVVLAIALAVGVGLLAPRSFWRRTSTIADYQEDASLEGRRNAWRVLGVIARERPLGGVGAGAFIFAWDRYAPLSAGGRHLVAHNIFMETLGELGFPALLFFCGFSAWLLLRLWKAGEDPLVGREAHAVFAALGGYLVCESVNGYALSWFLYFLFACAAAAVRLAKLRAALGREEASP